jgi:hypothetical protein
MQPFSEIVSNVINEDLLSKKEYSPLKNDEQHTLERGASNFLIKTMGVSI